MKGWFVGPHFLGGLAVHRRDLRSDLTGTSLKLGLCSGCSRCSGSSARRALSFLCVTLLIFCGFPSVAGNRPRRLILLCYCDHYRDGL